LKNCTSAVTAVAIVDESERTEWGHSPRPLGNLKEGMQNVIENKIYGDIL
jgi:hypothetical protein